MGGSILRTFTVSFRSHVRAQLVTSKGTTSDWCSHSSSIHCTGVSKCETLAGHDDYDEALALAEARHMRGGLELESAHFEKRRLPRVL